MDAKVSSASFVLVFVRRWGGAEIWVGGRRCDGGRRENGGMALAECERGERELTQVGTREEDDSGRPTSNDLSGVLPVPFES